MGDDQEAGVLAFVTRAQRIHRRADRLQRIDVEAGIGLVEHGVFRLQDRELEHLEALLFATREAVVDVAAEKGRVHIERIELVEHELAELRRRQIARFHRHPRAADEVGDRDAWDRGGVLKREKEAGAGAFVGRLAENFLAVERHGAAQHLVFRMPAHRERKRRFARAVGPHERRDAAGFDEEVDPFENFFAFDRDPQAADP